jgi:hypothetical protein
VKRESILFCWAERKEERREKRKKNILMCFFTNERLDMVKVGNFLNYKTDGFSMLNYYSHQDI